MAGVLIESGIYLLLLFTPFAFAGVELWAKGVLQIVAGCVVACWLLTRGSDTEGAPFGRRRAAALGIPMALFAILVLLQVVPLPPEWIRTLAPRTDALYRQSVPGYAEGEPFDVRDLPAWVMAGKQEEIPGGAGPPPDPLALDGVPVPVPLVAPAERTLSLSPGVTVDRLILFLSLAGIFCVVVGYYRTSERRQRLAIAAVAAGFLVSFVGILQKLTWNGRLLWIREGTYDNVFGPFVNRNSYAAFAGMLVPLAAAMALAAIAERARGRPDMIPRALLWAFASVTIAAGIFLSLSRGGILTTALATVGLFGLLIYYGRRAADLIALGVVVAACAGFLAWIGPEQVVERIGTLSAGQSVPSFAHRTEAWERIGPMIAENAALGTGLGTFRFAFMRYAPPGERWWSTGHNEYLELLSDTGVAGGALFAVGFAVFLSLAGRPWRLKRRRQRYLYAGALSGIAGLLIHATANSDMQVPAVGLMLTVLGGLILRVCVDAGRDAGVSP